MKALSLLLAIILPITITACSRLSEKDLANLRSQNDIVKREIILEISKQEGFPISLLTRFFDRNIENRAIAILVELINSGEESEDIQLSILKVLGDLGKRTEVPIFPIVEKIKEENPRIRFQAVESLGKIRNREAVPILLQLLATETNKYQIIWALGEMRDNRAIPALNQMLASNDQYLRYNARRALRKIR